MRDSAHSASTLPQSENNGQPVAKSCFIITPIGDQDSEIRRATDGVIRAVIRPVLEKHGYVTKAAHEISITGSITHQVIENTINADLVVANLTGLNANVLYELGLRHAVQKPVISIAQKNTRLPFDVADQRTIEYVDDHAGTIELQEALERAVESIHNIPQVDNPFVRTLRSIEVMRSVPEGSSDAYIIGKLEQMEQQMARLQSTIVEVSGLRPLGTRSNTEERFGEWMSQVAHAPTADQLAFRDALRAKGFTLAAALEKLAEQSPPPIDVR